MEFLEPLFRKLWRRGYELPVKTSECFLPKDQDRDQILRRNYMHCR